MHAHGKTQTPAPLPNTGGGDSVRDRATDQRTHALSAGEIDIHPAQNKTSTRFTKMGDSREARARARETVTAPAHAAMHAHRQTQTPAPLPNTRGSDSLRDRATDGSARTPSVHVTIFNPAHKTCERFAKMGDSLLPHAFVVAVVITV